MEKMIEKADTLKTGQLKEACIKMMGDTSADADLVMDAMLTVLMSRMTEEEFVGFTDEL